VKLTSLTIHRFREVVPGTSLTFHPSFNLLVGENGTGRTTLLELITRVLGGDFSGLLHEAFSLEYTFTLPGMTLHATVRNETLGEGAFVQTPLEGARSKTSLLLPPRGLAQAPAYEPFVELGIDLQAPGKPLRMVASSTGIAWEVNGRPAYAQAMTWALLERSVWTLLLMTAPSLEGEVKERLSPLLRKIFLLGPARFDESLGTFERLGEVRFAMEARAEELVPLGLMGLPTWLPRLLRERWTQGPAADAFVIGHAEVPGSFLSRFVEVTLASAGELRVDVLKRQAFASAERIELGRLTCRVTRRDGMEFSQEQLGHGHKRLLSWFYFLDVHEDFAVVDGLSHGLHPRWCETALQAVGGRQLFMADFGPLMFRQVPTGSALELRAALVFCRTRLREGRECFLWVNPTLSETQSLFEDLRTDGLPLEALLRERGLW